MKIQNNNYDRGRFLFGCILGCFFGFCIAVLLVVGPLWTIADDIAIIALKEPKVEIHMENWPSEKEKIPVWKVQKDHN